MDILYIFIPKRILILIQISPINGMPFHKESTADVTATPQRKPTERSRRLFLTPPKTPNSTLSIPPHIDNQNTVSESCLQQIAGEILPNESAMSAETSSASTIPNCTDDHAYGRESAVIRSVRKRPKKVNPRVEKLRSKLTFADRNTVLTLKQRASLNLGMKDETSASSVATAALSVPPVRDAIVSSLADELATRPDSMQNVKHGKVSVLMRKDYNDMTHTHMTDIVDEFMTEFPELFRLVLSIIHGHKDLTSETLRTLIPRLGMIYSILMQTRIPSLSRLQRVLTMALGDQICNQKVRYFITIFM